MDDLDEILVLGVPEELASCWRQQAAEAEATLEGWIVWICCFASVFGIPIHEVVLGQPPRERELEGVVWELRRRDSVKGMGDRVDNMVPVVDVRTDVRRRRAWSTK